MSSFSTLDAWCESSKTILQDKVMEWNINNQLRKSVSFDNEIQAEYNHHSDPMLCNNSPCTIHVQENRARISTTFNIDYDKEVSSVSTTGIPTTSETSIASIVVKTPIGTPLVAEMCTAPQLLIVEPLI